MNELNWGNAHLLPPDPIRDILQKYYQERYGDELTLAIKVARKNLRREQFREGYDDHIVSD